MGIGFSTIPLSEEEMWDRVWGNAPCQPGGLYCMESVTPVIGQKVRDIVNKNNVGKD